MADEGMISAKEHQEALDEVQYRADMKFVKLRTELLRFAEAMYINGVVGIPWVDFLIWRAKETK